MDKLKKFVEESKNYINDKKMIEWEDFCYSLYEKLREISIEVIEDSIKTMKLLETDTKLNDIVKEVGRSWEGGISYFFLTNIVSNFSKRGDIFKKQLLDMEKESKKNQELDEVMKKIR